MTKRIKPTKEQIESDYKILKSLRKVGKIYGYTGEGIRHLALQYGIEINTPTDKLYTYDHDFFSRDSEEVFYIAGFLAADGCVKARKGKDVVSVISCSLHERDELHLLKMRDFMGITNPLSRKLVKNKILNKKYNDSPEVELSFSSRKMCSDLKRFNIIQRKSLIYRFPEWLINHPLVNHFMRGYNDGDGSYFIVKGQVYFSLLGTKEFLTNYRTILEKECNLVPRIKDVRKRKNIYVLEYGGNGIVGKISKFLYKDATVFLERKRDKANYKNIL